MVSIGRPINGITINGNEYVCDENGTTILFADEKKAREFLYDHGMTDEEIANEGIVFEEETAESITLQIMKEIKEKNKC